MSFIKPTPKSFFANLNKCFKEHYLERSGIQMCFRIVNGMENEQGALTFDITLDGNRKESFTGYFTEKMFIWKQQTNALNNRILLNKDVQDFYECLSQRLLSSVTSLAWMHLEDVAGRSRLFLVSLTDKITASIKESVFGKNSVLLRCKDKSDFLVLINPMSSVRQRTLIDKDGTTNCYLFSVTNIKTGVCSSQVITLDQLNDLKNIDNLTPVQALYNSLRREKTN